MADRAQKVPENLPGPFFVDATCIDCELCREAAPANFTRQDEDGYSFVFKQPVGDEEEAACRSALEECPVEAIGDSHEP